MSHARNRRTMIIAAAMAAVVVLAAGAYAVTSSPTTDATDTIVNISKDTGLASLLTGSGARTIATVSMNAGRYVVTAMLTFSSTAADSASCNLVVNEDKVLNVSGDNAKDQTTTITGIAGLTVTQDNTNATLECSSSHDFATTIDAGSTLYFHRTDSLNVFDEPPTTTTGASTTTRTATSTTPSTMATDLVQDGTFATDGGNYCFKETAKCSSTFGPWTVTDGSVAVIRPTRMLAQLGAPDDANALKVDGPFNPGTAQQTLTGVTPGGSYSGTFQLAADPCASTAKTMDVLVDGAVVGSYATSPGGQSFTLQTFSFTADNSGQAVLAFASTDPQSTCSPYITQISVTAA